jgi:DNA helicase HerA-like ATPase
VAFVTDLVKTNRYFMRAESVREYERRGSPLSAIFPADRWEYLVARAQVLGVQGEHGIERSTFPPSPGEKVSVAEPELLWRFLGLRPSGGIEVGKLRHHELPVQLDLNRLLRKHLAVLAMSGAGKCLAPETAVHLSTGELIPIGELVDGALARGKEVEGGVEFTRENPDRLSVFTLGNGFRLRRAAIKAFARRNFSGRLLKIRLGSGSWISLTSNHPLLRLNGKARWVAAGELRPGDEIAAPGWTDFGKGAAAPAPDVDLGHRFSRLSPDLLADEIVRVDPVEYSGYVYDLAVEASDNFVANDLIVHNSNFAAVIVEEILSRSPEQGRPATVIMDVHGEYTGLAEDPGFSDRVVVLKGDELRIGVPNVSLAQFREFLPEMSGVQARELQRVLETLHAESRSGRGPFDLDDVIARVEGGDGVNKQLQQALVSWLNDLQSLGIFDRADNPNWERVVLPGRALVVDLSDMTSLRKKQVLVAYAARRLFHSRKRNRVPPFLLCLEEAHQFCPAGESKEAAISRSVLETIAREGRKFCASLMLISQRPVRLSTTVLSQANTNVILRITNPYDLEHIKQSSEAITSEVAAMISSLPVGEALIIGEAVNYPIFVKVRQRRSRGPSSEIDLEEAAREFERRGSREEDDARAFL